MGVKKEKGGTGSLIYKADDIARDPYRIGKALPIINYERRYF